MVRTAGWHWTTVAIVVVVVLSVLSAGAAVGCLVAAEDQLSRLPWQGSNAVAALGRARRPGVRSKALAAEAAVRDATLDLESFVKAAMPAHTVPVQVRRETGLPFPCVTVVLPPSSSVNSEDVGTWLIHAGMTPKKGFKEFVFPPTGASSNGASSGYQVGAFVRLSGLVRVRTAETAPPAIPPVPVHAKLALQALDDVFGGRHYVLAKAVHEAGLEAGDGPITLHPLKQLCPAT
jgi:hypothetical protein